MLCTRAILGATLLFPQISSAACIPFDQAQKHIGETQCITGKVIRVEAGEGGVHYLDFCEDHRLCSFSGVIFSFDLKNVGDVRQLAGRVIEIRGELKSYDDRAEIILENARQLGGTARLAPMPKNFDLEQRGHFSAGKFRAPHSRSSRSKRQHPTLPIEIRKTSNRIEPGVKPHTVEAWPFQGRVNAFVKAYAALKGPLFHKPQKSPDKH